MSKLKKLKVALKAARKTLYTVECDMDNVEDIEAAERRLDEAYENIVLIRDQMMELSIADQKHAQEVRRLCD
ncbi:MAG: hypothetical protein V3T23_00335 [Nitrososphaerales archaeon]